MRNKANSAFFRSSQFNSRGCCRSTDSFFQDKILAVTLNSFIHLSIRALQLGKVDSSVLLASPFLVVVDTSEFIITPFLISGRYCIRRHLQSRLMATTLLAVVTMVVHATKAWIPLTP